MHFRCANKTTEEITCSEQTMPEKKQRNIRRNNWEWYLCNYASGQHKNAV